ncbi:MFS transporter [Xanthobacter dioxanivorans]|uniref:hypothetical protein n=1 Tax=Xanthobacter dioxanivorans TaxID=2528964 RepID=UPI002FD353D4
MALFADDMRTVFWFALIPGALAVACVILGVEDLGVEDRAIGEEGAIGRPPPVRLADLRQFDGAFWGVVAIGVVFTLARFSEAFLVLKAHDEGLPLAFAPLVLVAMNVVYSLGAYPPVPGPTRPRHAPAAGGAGGPHRRGPDAGLRAGAVGRLSRHRLVGRAYGAHAGPARQAGCPARAATLRGSAFGLFNLATGIAMLVASVVAGCCGSGSALRRPLPQGLVSRSSQPCW